MKTIVFYKNIPLGVASTDSSVSAMKAKESFVKGFLKREEVMGCLASIYALRGVPGELLELLNKVVDIQKPHIDNGKNEEEFVTSEISKLLTIQITNEEINHKNAKGDKRRKEVSRVL